MNAKAKSIQGDAEKNRKPAKTSSARKPVPNVKPGVAMAQNTNTVSHLHGAEALAAMSVSESKLSRFKSKVILGLTLCLMLSLGWNSIQSATRPEPKLLATTADGRIFPLPLLDAPIESRTVILDWTRRNIPTLYDLDYVNYRSSLNKALDFTRRKTLDSFNDDLVTSGILTKIQDEFLILRANIVNEPVIINEQLIQNRRVWIIEVPMDLIYDSGDVVQGQRKKITQPILFTAWIARANPVEFDGGLMLAKYNVQNRSN